MRGLTTLVRRELRELRTLALVSTALAPLGTFGFQAAVTRHEHGTWNALIVLPVLVTFFALTVTADLFNSDARSGRLQTLVHFPVRLRTIWLAKVLAAALAILTFATWSFGVQVACLARAGGDEAVGKLLAALPLLGPWLPLLAALVAATMLWSTVRVGGLSSAVLGAQTVGGPLALALWLCERWDVPVRTDVLVAVTLAAAALLLVVSGLAVTRGRLHLGARWRPLLLGPGIALLVLAPVGLVGAREGYTYLAPTPDNPRMRSQALCASPDGRTVGVWAEHATRSLSSRGAWLISVETPRVWVAPGARAFLDGFTATGLGCVRVGNEELLLVDPTRGEVHGWDGSADVVAQSAWSDRPWGRLVAHGDESTAWVLRDGRSRVELELPPGARPWPQEYQPGLVLRETETGWLALDLDGNTERLIPGTAGLRFQLSKAVSPDGRYVSAVEKGGPSILSIEDGRVLRGPLGCPATWLPEAGGDALLCWEDLDPRVADGPERAWILRVESGEEVQLGALGDRLATTMSVAALPDGRFAVLRPEGSVELLAENGAPLRVLLGPDGER